jgi:hypothetical protein
LKFQGVWWHRATNGLCLVFEHCHGTSQICRQALRIFIRGCRACRQNSDSSSVRYAPAARSVRRHLYVVQCLQLFCPHTGPDPAGLCSNWSCRYGFIVKFISVAFFSFSDPLPLGCLVTYFPNFRPVSDLLVRSPSALHIFLRFVWPPVSDCFTVVQFTLKLILFHIVFLSISFPLLPLPLRPFPLISF